jgi:hypothetical protein
LPGGRLDRINGGQKVLKGRVKNNSRKPRDLTKNSNSDSLKKGQLFQEMMKRGNDAANDDDEDAVKTSVSQNPVTLHYVLRNCSSGLNLYVHSSLHISDR